MTPEEIEKLATDLEDIIFRNGYSIHGGDLRKLLSEETKDNERMVEKDTPAETDREANGHD